MKPAVFLLKVVAATSAMGVALDLVTAHVAVEYFTVHHPHVVDSDTPVVMALVWGVGASWWFGLIAAAILWWYNSRRPRPVDPGRIFRWIVRSLCILWLAMMAILAAMYALGSLVPQDKRGPTFEHDRRLMAVALTHSTEYVLGGIVLVVLLRKVAVQGRENGP